MAKVLWQGNGTDLPDQKQLWSALEGEFDIDMDQVGRVIAGFRSNLQAIVEDNLRGQWYVVIIVCAVVVNTDVWLLLYRSKMDVHVDISRGQTQPLFFHLFICHFVLQHSRP